MAVLLKNNAVSRLAASITTGATTLSVTAGDGAKFPSPAGGDWFPLTIIKSDGTLEILSCTGRSGDVLTVTRAQEGTAALAFNSGDRAELRVTAAALNTVLGGSGAFPTLGGLELVSAAPYVDFHYGSSSADFTTRIVADGTSSLSINSPARRQLTINDSGIDLNGSLVAQGDFAAYGGTIRVGGIAGSAQAAQFRFDGAYRTTSDGGSNWSAWGVIWNAVNFSPASKISGDDCSTAGISAGTSPYMRRAADSSIIFLQRALGYTPVQQGTGPGQLSNAVKIGWTSSSRVNLQVDAVDVGFITTDGNVMPILSLQGVGGVGTYAFCYTNVSATPGAVVSGSSLLYGHGGGQGSTNPPGTWRSMGDASAGFRTLFLRVS